MTMGTPRRATAPPMAFVPFLLLLVVASHMLQSAHSFPPPAASSRAATFRAVVTAPRADRVRDNAGISSTALRAEADGEDGALSLSDSEATALGVAGKLASVVMLYSESVLYQTGCGLPAGPFGLVGALEGVSYLGVLGLVGFSLYTKVRTGKGLPEGPGKLLGAAEGLAYLAVLAGVYVLFAQVTNYGYIPNAVPMEGAMCK